MFFGQMIEKFSDVLAPGGGADQALKNAVQAKDWGRINSVIDENGGLHAYSSGAKTPPIHMGAACDFLPLVEHCLSQGISANATDAEQETPLHAASRRGNKDCVELLVRSGGDVLAKNRMGQTPYQVASNLVVRQLLLPLQLKAEEERGLAPVIAGATTLKSHQAQNGLLTTTDAPPIFAPPPPPPAPPAAGGGVVPSSPGPAPGAGGVYRPITPNGFISSNMVQATANPNSYNQYSAFNSGTQPGQGMNARYVNMQYGAGGAQQHVAPQPAPAPPNLPTWPQGQTATPAAAQATPVPRPGGYAVGSSYAPPTAPAASAVGSTYAPPAAPAAARPAAAVPLYAPPPPPAGVASPGMTRPAAQMQPMMVPTQVVPPQQQPASSPGSGLEEIPLS
eukprot:CAMPEP_0119520042 /NCGR_PEP_ID=MMETSP1344-20130328/36156_1 /TAXON_ID=236787 /ORGANISM="Florenciella parvula, Strain CCMP2471" /LENGTH=392 /DNA_ID=CAMNT_0007557889 /DNA_START=82 /DNA_END=1260 /DNA_ORIENTATION=-